MQRLTGTIEKHRVGAPVPSTDRIEGWRKRTRRPNNQDGGCDESEEIRLPPNLGELHGLTSISAIGISPNISGEYIASTRVGGMPNVPALLKRTVYSIVNEPFGTYS
jgi:hypothetical protein